MAFWNVRDRPRALGIIAALALAFTAQYLFTGEVFTRFQDSNTWTWEPRYTLATALLLIAMACVGWGLAQSEGETAPPETALARDTIGPRVSDIDWLIGAGGCYGLSMLFYLTFGEGIWAQALWLVSIGLTILPLCWRRRTTLSSEAIAWWEWVLVMGLTVIGFALRYWHLTEIPSRVDNDVAVMGTYALELIRNSNYNWIGFSSSAHLLSYDQSLAWSMRLFGQDHYGLVMRSVISGTLTLPLVFWLGRDLFNRKVGFIAMALLTISYTHIHFSRILFGPTTTFFAVLVFYFLVLGLRTGQTFWFASAGVAMGLGLLIYDSSRVIPAIALAMVGWQWLWHRPAFQANSRNWGVFCVAALIAFGPMLGFAFKDFNSFVGRGNTVALWSPEVWQHEMSAYQATNAMDVLIEQVRHTFLTLHLYGDGSPHFAFPRPMVDPLTAALCALGVSFFLLRLRSIRYFVPVAWVVLTFVLGGIIAYDPPYWPHLNIALPAIVIMAAVAADKMIELFAPAPGQLGYLAIRLSLVSLIVLTGVFNWQAYYDYVKDNAGSRILAVRYLNALPEGYRVYMMSQGFSWNEFGFRFFNQGIPGQDLTLAQLQSDPPVVNGPAVFLVYEQPEVVQRLEQLYPGGEVQEHRNNEDRVLFISYKVVPAGYTFASVDETFNPVNLPGWWLVGGALVLLLGRAGFLVWRAHKRALEPGAR